MRIFILLFLDVIEYFGLFILSWFMFWNWMVEHIPDVSCAKQIIRKPYIRVLDKKGDLIRAYGEFHGKSVDVDSLPAHVLQALLSTEDKNFFEHHGFDLGSIFRAFLTNLSSKKIAQGGSSITQQLAKNILIMHKTFNFNDQSIARKAYELVLAFKLEEVYTKKEILTFYLNRVYFGSGTFGINAAAEKFYDKTADELNVYEAARLIGMIQAPSRYAGNHTQAKQRALQVIQNMINDSHITEEDKEIIMLLASEPENNNSRSIKYYFADWIVQQIPEWIFDHSADITVHTTLDPEWQEIAETSSKEIMDEFGPAWEAENVALVSTDYDGAIKAMVGGLDYSKSQFNNATQAYRQGGSLFKVVIYLTALENGYYPRTLVSDEKITFDTWSPKNFMYKSKGELPLQDAFAYSVNTVSVRLAYDVKPKKVIDMAQRLTILTPLPNDLSISLGTGEVNVLEMMCPMSTVANEGKLTTAYGIEKIVDTDKSEILFEKEKDNDNTVLDTEVANNMMKLLIANTEYGTGKRSKFGYEAGGKTGTSQNERDKWYMGFTANAITCVRFSTSKSEMKFQLGKPLHVFLWKKFMERLHEKMKFEKKKLKIKTDESTINRDQFNDFLQEVQSRAKYKDSHPLSGEFI